MTRINFTPAQARAVLWYLAKLSPSATFRDRIAAGAIAEQLAILPFTDVRKDERELLCRCVTDTTWLVYHRAAGVSHQHYNGAVRALYGARERIADAFGLDPEDIEFPQV